MFGVFRRREVQIATATYEKLVSFVSLSAQRLDVPIEKLEKLMRLDSVSPMVDNPLSAFNAVSAGSTQPPLSGWVPVIPPNACPASDVA